MQIPSAEATGTRPATGFGRIVDLEPRGSRSIDDAVALPDAEQRAVARMNADHRNAAIRRRTGRLHGPDGMDVQSAGMVVRLDFPAGVTGAGKPRKMLVQLAEAAQAKARFAEH